jgi:hypothetical protein
MLGKSWYIKAASPSAIFFFVEKLLLCTILLTMVKRASSDSIKVFLFVEVPSARYATLCKTLNWLLWVPNKSWGICVQRQGEMGVLMLRDISSSDLISSRIGHPSYK